MADAPTLFLPVAQGLDILVPAALYHGSLTDNAQASYEAIEWLDARPKPDWPAIVAACNAASPAMKAALSKRVDDHAEALRLTLITPGSGQAMEYQEAYAEAVQVDAAVKANPAATFDPVGFPMLGASLGYDRDPATGQPTTDIAGEARAVLAAYDAYQRAGAAIRAARLAGKKAIAAAVTAEAAQTAFAAIGWPALA